MDNLPTDSANLLNRRQFLLNLNEKPYDIHNIDILAGENMADNLIRAIKLDVEAALKKYGKASHH